MFARLLEIMKDPQPLTCFFCLTKSRPRDHEKPSCHHQPQSFVDNFQFVYDLFVLIIYVYLFFNKSKMVPVCVLVYIKKTSSSQDPSLIKTPWHENGKRPGGTLTMISGASGSTAFFLQPYEVIWINDRMGGRIFLIVRQVFLGERGSIFFNKQELYMYVYYIYSFIFNYVFLCIYIYIFFIM